MRPSAAPRGRDPPASDRPAPPLPRAPRVPRAAAPPATQVSQQETTCAPTAVHTGEGGRLSRSRRANLPRRPSSAAASADRSGGGCSAASRSNRASPPPAPRSRHKRPDTAHPRTPKLRGPELLGRSGRYSEGRPRVRSLFPSRSSGPTAATSRDPLRYLRLLPTCAGSGEAPPTAFWSNLFFDDFWGIFRRDPSVALRSDRLSLPSR